MRAEISLANIIQIKHAPPPENQQDGTDEHCRPDSIGVEKFLVIPRPLSIMGNNLSFAHFDHGSDQHVLKQSNTVGGLLPVHIQLRFNT